MIVKYVMAVLKNMIILEAQAAYPVINVMPVDRADILYLAIGWDPQIVMIFMVRTTQADAYNAMVDLPMKAEALQE